MRPKRNKIKIKKKENHDKDKNIIIKVANASFDFVSDI